MKFLDVFNEVQKGNYALTDEAVYASLQNDEELVPLYGGNKDHRTTERRISVTAKTRKGTLITIFSGEGIIISLDGSAGSMTYKNGERFALNHHAGFITLRSDAIDKVNLEFFSKFMQNFYRELGVSDGSKTLSLTQIYAEEFNLPDYKVQCDILESLHRVDNSLHHLSIAKYKLMSLLDKIISVSYKSYQGLNVPISKCIDYMSGNSGLTEEFIYQTLQNSNHRYSILSSSTEEHTMMGEVPMCKINNRDLKVFTKKKGLLVTRNGKAGQTRFLCEGHYTINDHAYILYVRENSPFKINLFWLSIQYKEEFLQYASNSDNGTWNMTGFFKHTYIDIPSIEEQNEIVSMYDKLNCRLNSIIGIEEMYRQLLDKEIL